MTEPKAWIPEITSKRVIIWKLDPEHYDKWDNIMEISAQTGRNWDRAWGLSETDMATVVGIIALDWIAKNFPGAVTFGDIDLGDKIPGLRGD
jgi:hypothetical protein